MGDLVRSLAATAPSFGDGLPVASAGFGVWMGGTATTGSTFVFQSSFFRGLDYACGIIDGSTTGPTTIFGSKLPAPVDDVRVAGGSPYSAMGVH